MLSNHHVIEQIAALDWISDLAQQSQLLDVAADPDAQHGTTPAQLIEGRYLIRKDVRTPTRHRGDIRSNNDPLRDTGC